MKIQNKHGGSRPNSGRKKGPCTTLINFRVNEDRSEILKRLVSRYLRQINKNINSAEELGVEVGIVDGNLSALYNDEWYPIEQFLNTYL